MRLSLLLSLADVSVRIHRPIGYLVVRHYTVGGDDQLLDAAVCSADRRASLPAIESHGHESGSLVGQSTTIQAGIFEQGTGGSDAGVLATVRREANVS